MKKILFTGVSLFKIKAAEGLQYRFAALSGATVSVFWALIEAAVLTVFFKYGRAPEQVNGMTLGQGVKYIWIAQFLFGLSATGVDGELLAKITNGDVGLELCRPMDLYWRWFAGTAAGKAGAVGLRGTFTIIGGAAITLLGFGGAGLGPPHSAPYFILFLVSVLNAFLFGTAYGMFLTSVRMNVAWGDGPINLIAVASMVLSGGYFPLQLWPDFLQTFLRIQPFAGYLDTPARLYAGTAAVGGAAPAVLLQIAWTAVFIALGKTIMTRKLKRVVIQGG